MRNFFIQIKIFYTNWELHGEDAPAARDKRFLDYIDCLIAIWDYKSDDIRNLLSKAFANNIPTYVYII